jgi:2-C-methyl-D-erythritol 4-phosphate cytidylyltransferase
MKISVILLAGGLGVRMGGSMPKQFLFLNQKPIAHYSLEIFLQFKEVEEIIVVCAPQYHHFFAGHPVKFAPPGKHRHDSVYNGLQKVSSHINWVSIHDSVRPFITAEKVKHLFDVRDIGEAAALAIPSKNTLKEVCDKKMVNHTLDRSRIWEVQTPQLLKKKILQEGFSYLHKHNLSVTDDVSIAELMGYPVKLILGPYENIKITTPADLDFAEWLIQKNTACALPMTEHATAAGRSSQRAIPSKG